MTLHLTDANGKVFNMTLEDLMDISKDMSVFDGEVTDHEQPAIPMIEPQVVDHSGESIDVVSLMDAIKKDPAKRPSLIDVTFEATHSGKNLNFFQYDSEELEKGSYTWKAPYAKPLIKNHDMDQEPIGRVHDFSFGASEFVEGKDTINVTFRVSDADAIDKFLDGRYRTMSIGASIGNVRCNVCGKDILKDGEMKFCGHMRGQKYGTEMAYWTAKDFTYKEGSVVNAPADVWAQVKKIAVVSSDNEKGGDPMTKDQTNVSDAVQDDVALLDDILADQETEQAPEVTDGGEEPIAQDNTPETEGEEGEAKDNETPDLQAVVDTLTAEVQALTDENQGLKDRVVELEDQVKTLEDQLAEREQELGDSLATARKQNVRLAAMNKQVMADRIADYEQYKGELTAEDREGRVAELVAMKASELVALTDFDFSVATTRQPAARVANPGIVKDSEDEAAASNTVEDTAQKLSYKTLEDSLIDLITRKY